VTARVIGTFLVWLQECQKPVFTIATSNQIQYLPPELISRFDETFFVNLPQFGERKDIFKIHIAKQPYDTINNYLLQPITAGDNGFWTNFDWNNAFRLAEAITGLKYSGQYGFAETWMYWPTTHMVQPKENALQCNECHSPEGRLDWKTLGYPGDPMEWGGRFDK
jgi:hypothetical protein